MKRVGIVGYGRFGRALGDLVRHHGRDVHVFEADPAVAIAEGVTASSLTAMASNVDVVVVATPVSSMPGVFDALRAAFVGLSDKLAPLVMDVGSVKVVPVRELERAFGAGARAVGTHPLFGPTSLAAAADAARAEAPSSRSVVVCEASSNEAAREAETFWRELGCDTILASAEEHDRVMARTHALAFFFAKGMVDAGLDAAPPFAPPSYQAIARSLEAVRGDANHLFRSIEVDNPFAAGVRAALLRALTAADATLPRPLSETRSLIDELDRELVGLLARRAALAEGAARAKDTLGIGTRDPAREAELLETRREWARASGLDAESVADVFENILRFSRAHQALRAGDDDDS